ncbi:unnamed protein product [Closterium sp. NIES-65]|nr:unnamed protein product [Closterium sp. NIES-65]
MDVLFPLESALGPSDDALLSPPPPSAAGSTFSPTAIAAAWKSVHDAAAGAADFDADSAASPDSPLTHDQLVALRPHLTLLRRLRFILAARDAQAASLVALLRRLDARKAVNVDVFASEEAGAPGIAAEIAASCLLVVGAWIRKVRQQSAAVKRQGGGQGSTVAGGETGEKGERGRGVGGLHGVTGAQWRVISGSIDAARAVIGRGHGACDPGDCRGLGGGDGVDVTAVGGCVSAAVYLLEPPSMSFPALLSSLLCLWPLAYKPAPLQSTGVTLAAGGDATLGDVTAATAAAAVLVGPDVPLWSAVVRCLEFITARTAVLLPPAQTASLLLSLHSVLASALPSPTHPSFPVPLTPLSAPVAVLCVSGILRGLYAARYHHLSEQRRVAAGGVTEKTEGRGGEGVSPAGLPHDLCWTKAPLLAAAAAVVATDDGERSNSGSNSREQRQWAALVFLRAVAFSLSQVMAGGRTGLMTVCVSRGTGAATDGAALECMAAAVLCDSLQLGPWHAGAASLALHTHADAETHAVAQTHPAVQVAQAAHAPVYAETQTQPQAPQGVSEGLETVKFLNGLEAVEGYTLAASRQVVAALPLWVEGPWMQQAGAMARCVCDLVEGSHGLAALHTAAINAMEPVVAAGDVGRGAGETGAGGRGGGKEKGLKAAAGSGSKGGRRRSASPAISAKSLAPFPAPPPPLPPVVPISHRASLVSLAHTFTRFSLSLNCSHRMFTASLHTLATTSAEAAAAGTKAGAAAAISGANGVGSNVRDRRSSIKPSHASNLALLQRAGEAATMVRAGAFAATCVVLTSISNTVAALAAKEEEDGEEEDESLTDARLASTAAAAPAATPASASVKAEATASAAEMRVGDRVCDTADEGNEVAGRNGEDGERDWNGRSGVEGGVDSARKMERVAWAWRDLQGRVAVEALTSLAWLDFSRINVGQLFPNLVAASVDSVKGGEGGGTRRSGGGGMGSVLPVLASVTPPSRAYHWQHDPAASSALLFLFRALPAALPRLPLRLFLHHLAPLIVITYLARTYVLCSLSPHMYLSVGVMYLSVGVMYLRVGVMYLSVGVMYLSVGVMYLSVTHPPRPPCSLSIHNPTVCPTSVTVPILRPSPSSRHLSHPQPNLCSAAHTLLASFLSLHTDSLLLLAYPPSCPPQPPRSAPAFPSSMLSALPSLRFRTKAPRTSSRRTSTASTGPRSSAAGGASESVETSASSSTGTLRGAEQGESGNAGGSGADGREGGAEQQQQNQQQRLNQQQQQQQQQQEEESKRVLEEIEGVALAYVEESVKCFPAVTPFDAFRQGLGSIARCLPPGRPATVLCFRLMSRRVLCLVSAAAAAEGREGSKGNRVGGIMAERAGSNGDERQGMGEKLRQEQMGMGNKQGGSEWEAAHGEAAAAGVSDKPEKRGADGESEVQAGDAGGWRQLLQLLLHLIPIVDVQVLPLLLQEVASTLVAIRPVPPMLVAFFQTLSFMCNHTGTKSKL